MRFLQNLMIILLLTASVPAFAQESTEEADNARVMEILQNLLGPADTPINVSSSMGG